MTDCIGPIAHNFYSKESFSKSFEICRHCHFQERRQEAIKEGVYLNCVFTMEYALCKDLDKKKELHNLLVSNAKSKKRSSDWVEKERERWEKEGYN